MPGTKKFWLIALVLLAALSAYWAVQKIRQGSAAYIYGYPLVLMELTRQSMAQSGQPQNRANHFTHNQIFPDHEYRNVVRPNNDTLYSISWLNLNEEPMILSVPDTQGRYYVMPLMDAWTNVYATIGKRTHGTQAGHFVLSGPNWKGVVPAGLEHVQAPTNMVWLIGRIQTNGKDDVPAVAELQKQFTLTPLSRWEQRLANTNYFSDQSPAKSSIDPNELIDQMSAKEFFGLLALLMIIQTPSPEDEPMLSTLEKIGITVVKNLLLTNSTPWKNSCWISPSGKPTAELKTK